MCNILPELICIWNDLFEVYAETILEGTFMCGTSFLVCTRVMTCVRAHVCSLEGTLVTEEMLCVIKVNNLLKEK